MDWNTLNENLEAACGEAGDEAIAERAVAAAEIVASAAGEPPDQLPDDAREWVETHGVPVDEVRRRALGRVARAPERPALPPRRHRRRLTSRARTF